MGESCQVDFYQLGSAAMEAERLACKLALMAWERGHQITILTENEAAAKRLDEMMWTYPEERFLPHELAAAQSPARAPVRIQPAPLNSAADVVINLTELPVDDPARVRRVLEIVPHDPAQRQASRAKYQSYRALGLSLSAHEIN